MPRPPSVFYRHSVTRISMVITGAFLTVALSPFGPPQWRNTPSLRWLHQVLPWWLLTALFAVYTLAHLHGSLWASAAGSWLGLLLFGWELVALIVTASTDKPTNPFAIAAIFYACVLHFAAARLATFQGARE